MRGKREGKMKTFFTVLLITAAVVFLVCIIFRGETPDKPKKNIKSDNPAILPYGKTGVLAHRSGAGLAPENTLLAFQNMIKNRDKFELEGFEFDLHLTKDGQIIVLHDDTLDRTSDSEEYFGKSGVLPCDLSFEELQKLNMGEKFVLPDGSIPYEGLRGDKIPDSLRIIRLSDVFDFLAPYGDYTFTVDIKNDGDIGYRTADELHRLLVKYNMLSRTAVASFHKSNIRYLDEKYPDITRSATIHEVVRFYFQSFFHIPYKQGHFKFKYLHIPYKDYFFNLGTTRLINYAHSYGIAVQYWTINDPKIMKRLEKNGADAVFTDLPDLAYETLNDIK